MLRGASVSHGGCSSTARPPHQTPRCQPRACCQPHDGRNRLSARPHTLSTRLGVLASTGLRVGEAIRLPVEQVKRDLQPPHLHSRETKFHKARLVPLHPTTTERLRAYHAPRAHRPSDGLSEAFFVSEQGHHRQYLALYNWCARRCKRLAIGPTDGGRAPCLRSFRHTFAVTCLQRWYQQGLDVQTLRPHLSVDLGHVHPHASYWYLTAVPALLSAAAPRCQTYAHLGGAPHAEAFACSPSPSLLCRVPLPAATSESTHDRELSGHLPVLPHVSPRPDGA